MPTIFTIGHSTRTLEELIEALHAHQIQTLMDIRSFPASRRLPHFNRESLEQALPAAGINYLWEKRLGGRRKKIRNDSPNVEIRVEAFRNYADYMMTPEFREAVGDLIQKASGERIAIMCAERLWWQCHRRMVSDWLTAHGHDVQHIGATEPTKPHVLMPEARLVGDDVIYKGDRLF